MRLRHEPHGSGHPYRYDLDQRVPVEPLVGEEFEIRATTDESAVSVVVVFSEGSSISAARVDPDELEQERGPFASGATEAGHLASAAEATAACGGRLHWRATAIADTRTTYRLVASGPDGEVRSATYAVDPLRWDRDSGRLLVGPSDHRLEHDSVEWLRGTEGVRRVRFALRLDPDQHVIGLGERYATIDHRGERYDSVVFEQYKHQGHRTYLPVPMGVVVGGEHWGFHVATSRRVWFDIGASDPDRLLVEAEIDPAQPELSVRLWDGTPAEVVGRFLHETGPPAEPPGWIFEPWMSSNEWNSQARVEAEVQRSLDADIPVGVVVIEAWSDESTFVAFNDAEYEVHADGSPHRLEDFHFPEHGRWPDPKSMVERLHHAGCKVLLWQIPLLPTDRGDTGQIAADLRTLETNSWAVQDASGAAYRNRGWWFPEAFLPDFTNPEVRRWWGDKRRYLLDEVGIDGFKTDGGEHLWGHDLAYHDGTTGSATNNRYPVLYAQTYHELLEATDTAGITFSRAGFTGSAAFPCHWAGDEDSTWEALRASIRAGLNAGVAGIYYWGWDLAGFSGPIPDAELYLRSAALATFCPIMQYHSEYNDHRMPIVDRTPWNIAERTSDRTVIEIYRRFAKLRRSLVPYLEQQSRRSLRSGKPLMRPLCFDHPDDQTIWAYPLQYQLGDDLVIAPITEPGQTEIEVYLPLGRWTDAFTGTEHLGPCTVHRTVPWDEIAVYRSNAAGDSLENVA